MHTTAADQATQGHVSPGGLIVLTLVVYAVAVMLGAPSPIALVRRVRTRPDRTTRRSQGMDTPATGDTTLSGQGKSGQESPLIPQLPPEPGDPPGFVRVRPRYPPGPRPLAEIRVAAGLPPEMDTTTASPPRRGPHAGRAGASTPPTTPPPAGQRRHSRTERLQWLADREQPGDPIAALHPTRSDLDDAAATALGVDTRTIRRDRAHLTAARRKAPQ